MNAETFRELLRRQPFEPFEVRMTNGDVHQVRRPEIATIVGGRAVLGFPDTGRIVILSLLHAAAIELMERAA